MTKREARQYTRGPKPGHSILRIALLAAAALLIVLGILNGSMRDVLRKAIYLCTECIGLG